MNRRLLALLSTPLLLALAACGGADTPRATPATPPVTGGPVPSVTPGADCLTPPERPGVVRFPSANGASIAGVVLGPAPTGGTPAGPTGGLGVVLAHQTSSDMCQWVPYGRTLVKRGYTVLAIDLNGYGASSASAGNPSQAAYEADVVAAAGHLRGRGVGAVALVGASLGGMASVAAAAELKPPPAAVVDLSGPAQMAGTDAAAAAPKVTAPLLFVVGADDQLAGDVTAVAKAATGAATSRLEVLPGTGSHGVALLDPTQEARAAQVTKMIEDFLAEHAG